VFHSGIRRGGKAPRANILAPPENTYVKKFSAALLQTPYWGGAHPPLPRPHPASRGYNSETLLEWNSGNKNVLLLLVIVRIYAFTQPVCDRPQQP
jgi:hypothetical protein